PYGCTAEESRAFHDRRSETVARFYVVEVAVFVLDGLESVIGIVRDLGQRGTCDVRDVAEDGGSGLLHLVLRRRVGLALAGLRDCLCFDRGPSRGSYRDGRAGVVLQLGCRVDRVGNGLGNRGSERGSLGCLLGGGGRLNT